MKETPEKSSVPRPKKYRTLKRFLMIKLFRLSLPEYTVYTIYSIAIGIAAGLAAVLFHHSIAFFNSILFEQTQEGLYFLGAAAVIVIPAIGMFIQALMIKFFPDIAKRKGVSEIIKTVAVKGGYIPLKTTIFHFLAPVICIGSGGSVGPEGPAAQLGGGLGSKFGNFLGLSEDRIRVFTAAGAGAAIAAIFNTPLGGVFFALEIVLLNDFHAPTFSALILASVSASAVSRILLGNESVFVFHSVQIQDYSQMYVFAILGVLSGLISVLFINYSVKAQHFFRKNIYQKGIPQWAVMIAVGLLVGVCGYFYKELFGIGYNAINEILGNSLSWQIVLILLVLKFLLVPIILSSGGFGGVFAPSLFMGASFGFLLHYLLLTSFNVNIDPVTMVLVGMGAMLGGVNTIPISAILIVFEMTQDYSYILPLMLAVIISNMIAQLFLRGSIHIKHLESEGFKLSESKELNLLKSIKVKDIELEAIEMINENTSLPQLMSFIMTSPKSSFFVINADKKLSGIITESELRPILTEYESLKDVLIARDIANPNITLVKTSDDLDYVLGIFGKYNLDQFPVIDPDNEEEIIGSITRQKVLSVYNRESLRLDLADGLAKELKHIGLNRPIQVAPGFSIIEEPVPEVCIGRTLSELKLRNRFSIEVLMIKHYENIYSEQQKPKIITPNPQYRLKNTDKLVIFGSAEALERFKRDNY